MKIFSLISKTYQRFGLFAVAKVFLSRVLQKLFFLDAMEVIYLELPPSEGLQELPDGMTARFLTEEEITHYSKQTDLDLTSDIQGRISSGKDFCYAAFSGDRIAAYGWYALGDIEAEHHFDVSLSFPSEMAYMYKGLTHPDFRGKRLHGILMHNALLELKSKGVNALISSVGWTNFASLSSCRKLGYQKLGRLWTAVNGQKILRVPRKAAMKKVAFGLDIQPHCPH